MPVDLLEAVHILKIQYGQLSPTNVDVLLNCYSTDAIFRDPFQEVQGHLAIKHIFLQMYEQLNQPQFIVREQLLGEKQVAFLWDFQFSMKRWNTSPKCFSGVSWLYFNDAFLVTKHHDYWDPAAGIYEHLPLIGSVMRGLKSLV
jgi:steroid delta-isomerase